MSTERIRGGAGIAFAILGLLLLYGGPGFSVSSAATGCMDTPNCFAEGSEEGVITDGDKFIATYTSSCQGDCAGGIEGYECVEITTENPDSSRSFHCSCDPDMSPAGCSGFPKVDSQGRVQHFFCAGDCGGAQCREMKYNVVVDSSLCPAGYSLKRKCVCE